MDPEIEWVGWSISRDEAETLLDNVGTALSKLRRRTMQVALDPPAQRGDLRRDLVLASAAELADGVGVREIADRLGVDSPAASRLSAALVEQGLLVRVAAQRDGRRTVLQLTPAGAEVLARSRRQQRDAFQVITAEWPEGERVLFAHLLDKYAQASSALPQPPER